MRLMEHFTPPVLGTAAKKHHPIIKCPPLELTLRKKVNEWQSCHWLSFQSVQPHSSPQVKEMSGIPFGTSGCNGGATSTSAYRSQNERGMCQGLRIR